MIHSRDQALATALPHADALRRLLTKLRYTEVQAHSVIVDGAASAAILAVLIGEGLGPWA
jgi:hypothetical protein